MPQFRPKDVCVVIPTRRRWDMLERTLRSLRDQTVKGFEVIVLADAPEDEAHELKGARLIKKPGTGVSTRRNLGARSTECKIILLLGDDTIPAEDLIERHVFRHNQDPDRTVAILGKIDWHPEVAGNPLLSWLDRSGLQFDYDSITGGEAGWARFYASNLSIKRDLFLEVGGFDEDFIFTYEDLDIGLRLGEAGMRLLYEPEARVFHHHVYDIDALRRRFEATAEGEWLMIKKHPDFPPFFAPRLEQAERAPKVSQLWPLVVDRIPKGNALRRRAESRTHVWYLQHIAGAFLARWEGQRDREELIEYLGPDYDEDLLRRHEAVVEQEFDDAPTKRRSIEPAGCTCTT